MARPRTQSKSSRRTAGSRRPARGRTLGQTLAPSRPAVRRDSSDTTPYVVGGTIVAGTLLYLLWPRLAPAAILPPRQGPVVLPPPLVPIEQIPPTPPPARPANGGIVPPMSPVLPQEGPTAAQKQARELAAARAESLAKFPQVPNAPDGYQGPGVYRVIAVNGLNLRRVPSATTGEASLGRLLLGTNVEVVTATTNGWAQISSVIDAQTGVSTPEPGYLCLSCVEAQGGPWLVRES